MVFFLLTFVLFKKTFKELMAVTGFRSSYSDKRRTKPRKTTGCVSFSCRRKKRKRYANSCTSSELDSPHNSNRIIVTVEREAMHRSRQDCNDDSGSEKILFIKEGSSDRRGILDFQREIEAELEFQMHYAATSFNVPNNDGGKIDNFNFAGSDTKYDREFDSRKHSPNILSNPSCILNVEIHSSSFRKQSESDISVGSLTHSFCSPPDEGDSSDSEWGQSYEYQAQPQAEPELLLGYETPDVQILPEPQILYVDALLLDDQLASESELPSNHGQTEPESLLEPELDSEIEHLESEPQLDQPENAAHSPTQVKFVIVEQPSLHTEVTQGLKKFEEDPIPFRNQNVTGHFSIDKSSHVFVYPHQTIKPDDFQSLIERLITFAKYQNLPNKPPAIDAAHAGFISITHWSSDMSPMLDDIICLWCTLQMKDLKEDMNLLALHRAYSRNSCAFLQGNGGDATADDESLPGANGQETNITSSEEERNLASQIRSDFGDDGLEPSTEMEKLMRWVRIYSRLEWNATDKELQELTKTWSNSDILMGILSKKLNLPSLGVVSVPEHTGMALESNRIGSMVTYNNRLSMTMHNFVTAGWYWYGQGDKFICYACGVSCSDWSASTDPMVRHILLKPDCPFITSSFTSSHIAHVIESNPPYTPPPFNTENQPAVETKAVKPRFEYSPVIAVVDNAMILLGISREEAKDLVWSAVSRQIQRKLPDFTSEVEVVQAVLEMLNELQTTMENVNVFKPVDLPTIVHASKPEAFIREQAEPATQITGGAPGGHNEISTTNAVDAVDQIKCRICYNNITQLLFIPCTHIVACLSCGMMMNNCPVCRAAITGTVRINL